MINKVKDWIINTWLLIYNRFLYYILNKRYGSYLPINPPDYTEDFSSISKEEFDALYIRRQFWGVYHPDNLQQWYDPAAVVLSNNGLHLEVTDNKFTINDNEKLNGTVITNGVGLVTSNNTFSYGRYTWTFILPKGKLLWPAIWLTHAETWPPEIDVFEGYSNEDGHYGKNVNTNIHCGNKSANHYGLGAFRGGFLVSKDTEVRMDLHWTKDFIKIYYNGFLVRQVTTEKDLIWFNVKPSMRIVMNNALRNKTTYPLSDFNQRDFIVKSFEYREN